MEPKNTGIHIELTAPERAELEQRARALRAAHRNVIRARIILALADGLTLSAVGRQVGAWPANRAALGTPIHGKAPGGTPGCSSQRATARFFPR